jgi:hypothetical protein
VADAYFESHEVVPPPFYEIGDILVPAENETRAEFAAMRERRKNSNDFGRSKPERY